MDKIKTFNTSLICTSIDEYEQLQYKVHHKVDHAIFGCALSVKLQKHPQ